MAGQKTIRDERIRPTGFGGDSILVTADTSFRDPYLTPGLWDDCPLRVERMCFDPNYGKFYQSNYLNVTPASNAIGGFTTTVATSGTVTTSATGGGLVISAGAVTAGQGINLQMIQTAFTPTASKPIWMEGSVAFSGLAATPKVQFLFGLAAASTTLIASNAVGTGDQATFSGVSTTGVMTANTTLSTTATTATGFTIANNTTYKLGIKLTTTAAYFWVNGVLVTTNIANIPAAALAPSVVVQGNGTVTPVATLQWLQVFQQR